MTKLQDHDKRFDEHDKRFDQLDHQVDFLAKKSFEHDEQFTKVHEEIRQFRNEYLDGQDKMMQILNRLDQERVFTNLAIQRLTEGLEKTKIKVREHEQEITAIKHQLHLH